MKAHSSQIHFNEIWPTLLASLACFCHRSGRANAHLADWMVNHGVPPFHLAKIDFFSLPGMILFALPAVLLMAVFGASTACPMTRASGHESFRHQPYQMLRSVVLIP